MRVLLTILLVGVLPAVAIRGHDEDISPPTVTQVKQARSESNSETSRGRWIRRLDTDNKRLVKRDEGLVWEETTDEEGNPLQCRSCLEEEGEKRSLYDRAACTVCKVFKKINVPWNRGCPTATGVVITSTAPGYPITATSTGDPSATTTDPSAAATQTSSATTSTTTGVSSTASTSTTTGSSTGTSISTPAATATGPPYAYGVPFQGALHWEEVINGTILNMVRFSSGEEPPDVNNTILDILQGGIVGQSDTFTAMTPVVFQSEIDAYNASRLDLTTFSSIDPQGMQAVKFEQVSTTYPNEAYHGFTFAVENEAVFTNETAYSEDTSNPNLQWDVLIAMVCGMLPEGSDVSLSGGAVTVLPGLVPPGTVGTVYFARNPVGIANIPTVFASDFEAARMDFCVPLMGQAEPTGLKKIKKSSLKKKRIQ